jgi:hypothetical protein
VYAETIDYGPYVGYLRAFGPPEVAALPDFAGNVSAVEKASGFWELVQAVTFLLTNGVAVANRFPRLSFFAGESVPFAQVQAPFALVASNSSRYTFALGAQVAGAANAPTIVTTLPQLVLLPGWTLKVDVVGGAAADAVSDVRVARQRYEVIRGDEG